MRSPLRLIVTPLLLTAACSSGHTTTTIIVTDAGATGGAKSTGIGTSASVGGNTNNASSKTTGALGTGGTAAGNTSSTVTAAGGTSSTVTAAGGTSSTVTAAGGTSSTVTAAGGSVSGGVASTGGLGSSLPLGGNGAGGVATTSTTASLGGISASGGATASATTGGKGGAAAGGAATGGKSSVYAGGAAAGGSAGGGAVTGGHSGIATGGAATGGAATGGAATGGAATGGAATGGAATGGAATGGAATGGAPCQVSESCDGIDNDCDGKVDLSDGLTLSGTNVSDIHNPTNVAWSPSTSKFVVVGVAASKLYFGTLSTAGTMAWNSSEFSSLANSSDGYSKTSIAWAPAWSIFGIAFHIASYPGDYKSEVDLMSPTGVASDVFSLNSIAGAREPALAARSSTGDLLVTFHTDSSTFISRIDRDAGLRSGATIGEAAIKPRIATSGDLSAIVYQVKDSTTIDWARANASTALVSGYPEQLATGGQLPDIATTHGGSNYSIAWATATGFKFQIMKAADGSTVCGPLSVAVGNGALDVNDGLAIAATQYGNLVFFVDSAFGASEAKLFRISDSCTLIDSAAVRSTSGSMSDPVVAVGGGYAALSWTDWTEDDGYLSYTRVMRDGLCN